MKIVSTINDALYELGVVDVTEEPTPEDSAYALRTLNRILDEANTQDLTLPYLRQIQYPEKTQWGSSTIELSTQSGNQPYEPEPDPITYETIDAAPPQSIHQLFFRDNANEMVDYICTPMTQTEFARLPYKSIVSIPTKYFIQKQSSTQMMISFDCVPQDGLYLNIFGRQPYRTDFELMDDVEWGTGVESYLMLMLAVRLSNSYHIQPPSVMLVALSNAENRLKALNYRPQTLKLDKTLQQRKRHRRAYNLARI